MASSKMFSLPSGKASADSYSDGSIWNTPQKPQTWSAAVPQLLSGWQNASVEDVGVTSIAPKFVPMDANRVGITSIQPTYRPALPGTAIYAAGAKPAFSGEWNPQAVPAVMNTRVSTCAPQAVPAAIKPAWPAPASVPAQPITAQEVSTLPVSRSKASNIIGASIFGGPITVGDAEVTTLHISPYREEGAVESKPAPEAVLNKEEGWTDVFGMAHGSKLPTRRTPNFGRGAFNLQAPLSSVGALRSMDVEGEMSTTKKVLIGAAAVAIVGGGIWFFSKKR